MNETIPVETIGIIHSPFTEMKGMPVQSLGAQGAGGTVVVDERFAEGLRDLDGFSHIYLIYRFHMATRTELKVVPYMDTVTRGVFATRSPLRPAHIGVSVVELLKVSGNVLTVRGLDMLDGTPLIDIKPYVPQFDCWQNATSGWMKASRFDVEQRRSDNRFA
ncbi:MAG: tRNA (N6-threonylcarbamoyladenosine(37)-N6)-methyltransferase TrmO [Dehalococcoidia bacterium]|nr:tRNA (N6-threonylcarbamoyladenosine(37)-N6)-methyltransferase TrmO [Dehalococcoidia bacterium]